MEKEFVENELKGNRDFDLDRLCRKRDKGNKALKADCSETELMGNSALNPHRLCTDRTERDAHLRCRKGKENRDLDPDRLHGKRIKGEDRC